MADETPDVDALLHVSDQVDKAVKPPSSPPPELNDYERGYVQRSEDAVFPGIAKQPDNELARQTRGCLPGISYGSAVGAAVVALVALIALIAYLVLRDTGSNGHPSPSNAAESFAAPVSNLAAPTPTLGAPTPTPCTQWDVSGTWETTQANGYTPTFTLTQNGTTVTGFASIPPDQQANAGYKGNTADATGTLVCDQLHLIVTWPPKANGVVVSGPYDGTVARGTVDGTTGATHSVTWSGTGPSKIVSGETSSGG